MSPGIVIYGELLNAGFMKINTHVQSSISRDCGMLSKPESQYFHVYRVYKFSTYADQSDMMTENLLKWNPLDQRKGTYTLGSHTLA